MRKLKLLLLFVFIFVCSEVVYCQTFKIVGFKGLPPNTSQERFEREKGKALGSKIYLETFPNDIKFTMELDKDDAGVFSKKARNHYEYTNPKDNSQKVVLKLNTIGEYIRGGEVQYVNKGQVKFTILFKRDGIF